MPAPGPEPMEGVTKEGYPITKRGHVSLEVAAMEVDSGFGSSSGTFFAATALDASARLTGGLFANLRFASGALLFPGNMMAGADYLIKVGKANWITVGGALGIPLAQDSQTLPYSFANAMWNVHEFAPNYEPLRVDLGYEMVSKSWGLRIEVQPVFYFPYDQPGADVEAAFQHAVEVQYGHSLGVGLRLQGVASTLTTDDYQAAVEPFVFLRRDVGFVRLGLMKTLDEDQSSPYREAWGARFSAGFHLD